MQAAGFVVRRWTARWRRCWPIGKNDDDFKRDSKLAFYSVLWKQHVYIAQVELLKQHCRWRRSTSWGKRMGDTTGQEHATEAKNHFATWSQKWRQWSWTPCEAQTEGNFGMPPSKCNHRSSFGISDSTLSWFSSLQQNTSRVSLFLSCFVF